MSLRLPRARLILANLGEELSASCERLEVAGSVRRQKDIVGDLELVAIPKVEEREALSQGSLFETPTERVSLLWEVIDGLGADRVRPIKPGRGRKAPEFQDDDRWTEKRLEGSRYFRLWLPRTEAKLDLFIATPETWGCVFLIRTGAAAFSAAIVKYWTRRSGGGHFSDGRLCDRDGRAIDAPEEKDVFRELGLRFIPPEDRPEGTADSLDAISQAVILPPEQPPARSPDSPTGPS